MKKLDKQMKRLADKELGGRGSKWAAGSQDDLTRRNARKAQKAISRQNRKMKGNKQKSKGCAVILMTGGAAVTGAAYALSHWL